MNLVLGYVVIVGAVTAVAKMARGAIQAIHKVAEGKHAEGSWKLASGLVAPVKDAGQELWRLGAEAVAAAQVLCGKVKGRSGQRRISDCAGETRLG